MKAFRRKSAVFWGTVLVSFLMTYILVCPSICSATQVEVTQVGGTDVPSCHSDSPDSNSNDNESKLCCQYHEDALLKKKVSSFDYNTMALLYSSVITQKIDPISINSFLSYDVTEGPPLSTAKRPLYMIKNAFLI